LLEGSDDSLKRQYVVVSAHMDGGADDNAVGVAALLALAKAWSAPAARPC
jgi:Zn-dependent M28 family amino/carboxypeptidase